MTDELRRDPEDWKTGDEPMTDAQASYLRTLSEEMGEPFDDGLTKAQASERIDALRARSPRIAAGEAASGDSAAAPGPNAAEVNLDEGSQRPPRPSQAEGER
jgi:hypothetical protein